MLLFKALFISLNVIVHHTDFYLYMSYRVILMRISMSQIVDNLKARIEAGVSFLMGNMVCEVYWDML